MDVTPEIRAADAPSSYQAYLNSPTWRMTRNRALKLAGYRCSRCPSKRDLNVHHRTYERLGAELDTDLEVLCFTCHNGHHREAAKMSEIGIYLKLVSVIVTRNPFANIADIAEDVKLLCAEHGISNKPYLVAKAISYVCATRLKEADKPYVSVVEPSEEPEPTKAQAIEWLQRFRVFAGAPVGPTVMPEPYRGGNGPDHEKLVRAQANAMGFEPRPKDRIDQRLEDIFAGRL
jgi:hypothetical protein